MDDVIRIIKLIKKSNLVLDGGINIVKHKKIQERGLMLVLLEGLDGSMLGNIMNEKYVMRVGKGFVSTGKKMLYEWEDEIMIWITRMKFLFFLHPLPLCKPCIFGIPQAGVGGSRISPLSKIC